MVENKLTKYLLSFFLILFILHQQATSEVHRLYSQTSGNGRSYACGRNPVVLKCHTSGSRVIWTTTSDLIRRIVFISTDANWTVNNQEAIIGILQQNSPQSDGSNLRNFVTELRVYSTSSTREINVACSSNDESSSHVIVPSAFPEPPLFKTEPTLFRLADSNVTSPQYYIEWDPPTNSDNIDLDHYQVYTNDNLVQRVHADQQYAIIKVEKDATTTVKIAAADKCGQVSNYSVTSITPSVTTNSNSPQTTTSTYDITVTVASADQSSYSGSLHLTSNLAVIVGLGLTLLALMV